MNSRKNVRPRMKRQHSQDNLAETSRPELFRAVFN